MARQDLAHGRNGTLAQTDEIYRVSAASYVDPERFRAEMDRIFLRLPLMLAATAELREPGAYKALEAAGVQVLLTRTRKGEAKAFVNMCSHRGARLVPEGHGTAHRFTCPYHAWTYSPEGDLVSVYLERDFGTVDKACNGLTELPTLERAGLIWVTLDPRSALSIESFLCGYDALLAEFGFESWHHHASQVVRGPNWKVAYDGYLDYYHLPILHRNSFGPDMHNQANYYAWGPHQRVGRPNPALAKLQARPEDEWPMERLLDGVWTIFPHVSIASFDGGGRSVMISQLFPGTDVGSSYTVQNYLMEHAPEDDEALAAANQQFAFLRRVVEEEDYATGLALQKNLGTGARDYVLFGRNEAGGQNFHRWVQTLLDTDDDELPRLFPAAG
jgi:phenylpropionate dioxygenase-like ring-hydroxylating dioxygenase large terminal subunit